MKPFPLLQTIVNSLNFDSVAQLPEQLLFGTSSWTYPGWNGQVYHRTYSSEAKFRAESLAEYAQCPLFRTVGLDSSFYGPPSPKTLARMKGQLPEGFPVCSKVWEELTVYEYPKHKRYGAKAGTLNQNFLNPDVFAERVLRPYEHTGFESNTGPFIFQFGAFPKPLVERQPELLQRLESFFSALPPRYRYAAEVRNPGLLNNDYFQMLNRVNATHCFNHWTHMPAIRTQMEAAAAAGGLSAPFYVCRVLTPIGLQYEQAVKRFSPYTAIGAPIPQMRHDVALLGRRALKRKVPAFVLVNNRSEGNAPQTIIAIGEMIQQMLSTKGEQSENQ